MSISKYQARKIIEEENNLKYFECSARAKSGVSEIFNEAMKEVISHKKSPSKFTKMIPNQKQVSKVTGQEGKKRDCNLM